MDLLTFIRNYVNYYYYYYNFFVSFFFATHLNILLPIVIYYINIIVSRQNSLV